MIGIKIHVLEKIKSHVVHSRETLKQKQKKPSMFLWGRGCQISNPSLVTTTSHSTKPPFFFWGDIWCSNETEVWNEFCRRSLWPLWRWRLSCWGRGVHQQRWNMTWWNSGEVLLYKSVSTWTNASGGYLNVKMMGKNPLWDSTTFGVQDMVYKDSSGEQNPGKCIILHEGEGEGAWTLEERTNTLLLCTRFGTSWGWRHLTSLEFAYMNWDAGADA